MTRLRTREIVTLTAAEAEYESAAPGALSVLVTFTIELLQRPQFPGLLHGEHTIEKRKREWSDDESKQGKLI